MADVDPRTRSIEERIARLRSRVKDARRIVSSSHTPNVVVDVHEMHGALLGILDLLGDEL